MIFTSVKFMSVVRAALAKAEPRCASVRSWLPGYLDGTLPEGNSGTRLRARMAQHLEVCASCRAELKSYQALSRIMLGAPAEEPPEELALAIRIAVARGAGDTGGIKAFVERCQHRLSLLFDHVVEPLLIPVTGGALVALLVFAFVFPILGGGLHLPLPRTTADLPTSLMQPARLQTLAGFSLPGLDDGDGRSNSQGLLVEATVNADGQAVSYRVLGDPLDLGTQRQLDRVVFFSRFRPQLSFGTPTSSGRVVLGFSQIYVRG